MRGEIEQRDGLGVFGDNHVGRSEALQRVVKFDSMVGDKFDQDIVGEDFGKRAKPQQRIPSRNLMRAGRGLAVSAEKNLIIAHDDENHAGRA